MPEQFKQRSPLLAIAPVAGVVFTAFFVTGVAMPVLPLHVHQRLGMGAFTVGLVAGCQFIAALLSRFWAGRIADTRGPKRAVLLGLAASTAGGACYLVSLLLISSPPLSVAAVLVGRTLVGGAESLIITGGMLWGLGRVASERSAQVISWVGMSLFAAMAIGAPVGSLIYDQLGFLGIALASLVAPLLALAFIVPIHALRPVHSTQTPLQAVAKAVLLPGLGFALSGITFGAVTAFLTLYFAENGWAHGALAFSVFAAALIGARILGGHLPDRLGGAQVALYSLAIQALGIGLVSAAQSSWAAMAGALLAGVGFSLVFPSLGLEAVRRVPPANRGIAMGAYNAFLDLTMGVGSPVLGFLAAKTGIGSVFIASAIAALLAMPIVHVLRRQHGPTMVIQGARKPRA